MEEWTRVSVHHLGSKGYGIVAKAIGSSSKPTKPDSFPSKPVEPTADLYQAIVDAMPLPLGTTPPTRLDLVRVYQSDLAGYELQKATFATATKDWEEFSKKNIEAFSSLRDCISDESYEHICATTAGADAAGSFDTFGLFAAAIASHAIVEKDLEGVSRDVAEAHLNRLTQGTMSVDAFLIEQDKRLAALKLKWKSTDIYYDDIRKITLTLSRLNPSWNDWQKNRNEGDNMPKTYASLCTALRTYETRNTLKSAVAVSSEDVKAGVLSKGATTAAHATTSLEEKQPCAIHTSIGQARVAATHTTAECKLLLAVIESRKEPKPTDKKVDSKHRSETKPKKNKSKAKYAQPKLSSSSTQVQKDVSSDSDDSDDIVSGCCTRVDTVSETDLEVLDSGVATADHVYFDNCATGCMVKDKALCHDLRSHGSTTRVTGSIPGLLVTKLHGTFGPFGHVAIHESFSKNIVSEKAAIAAGYGVYASWKHAVADGVKVAARMRTPGYLLVKRGAPHLHFAATSDGVYAMSAADFISGTERALTVNAVGVSPPGPTLHTSSQRRRADLAYSDHIGCFYHLAYTTTEMALRAGAFENPDYTVFDMGTCKAIHGPCDCDRIRRTRPAAIGKYRDPPTAPGQQLVADIMFIMSKPYLLVTCRLIKYRIIHRLQGKNAAAVLGAFRKVLDIWKGHGYPTNLISFDREKAVLAIQAELWAVDRVKLSLAPPEGHEKLAEREVRTIKERVYPSLLAMPCRLPAIAVEGFVYDVVRLSNRVPNAETYPETPLTFLGGERLNVKDWRRFKVGDFAHVFKPYNAKSSSPERYELAFIIGHLDNGHARALLLPHGKAEVVRDRRLQLVTPTPAHYKMLEDLCKGDAGVAYDQLVQDWAAEIKEDSRDEEHEDPAPLQIDAPRAPVQEHRHPASDERTQAPLQREAVAAPTPGNPRSDTATPAVVQQRASEPSEVPQEQPTLPHVVPTPTPHPAATMASVTPPEFVRPRRAAAEHTYVPGFFKETRINYTSLPREDAPIDDIYGCNMNHKQVANLHGQDLANAAGIKEVMNIIGREAVHPALPRSLTQKDIDGALPSFMFYKAKDLSPDEISKAEKEALKALPEWDEVRSKRDKKAAKKAASIKIKARWVTGGNHQTDVDKTSVASPTARTASHNILLSIAAKEGRSITIGDVPAAYLQTPFKSSAGQNKIHVRMDKKTAALAVIAYPHLKDYLFPDGTMMCEVAQALYGLVESAWLWYKECTSTLEAIGYVITDADLGVMMKKDGDSSLISSVHSDDFLAVASATKKGKALEAEFWGTLEAKYPGIVIQRGPHFRHLGCEIQQDVATGVIKKSQGVYTKNLLKHNGVTGYEKLPYRLDITEPKKDVSPLKPKQHGEYRSVVQAVAYLHTRPTIAWIVSHLQRRSHAPDTQDLADLWHLLRYLNKYPEVPLVFAPTDLQLRAKVDASFAVHDERSHYGYVLTLGGGHCAPVACKSGSIKPICRSATEAEIHGVNECLSEILWTVDLLTELGYAQQPVTILEDNEACITMLQKKPRNYQTASKHVRVKWHFYRQQYKLGKVIMEHCPTNDMTADILTKPLGGKLFRKHAVDIHNTTAAVEGCVKDK